MSEALPQSRAEVLGGSPSEIGGRGDGTEGEEGAVDAKDYIRFDE